MLPSKSSIAIMYLRSSPVSRRLSPPISIGGRRRLPFPKSTTRNLSCQSSLPPSNLALVLPASYPLVSHRRVRRKPPKLRKGVSIPTSTTRASTALHHTLFLTLLPTLRHPRPIPSRPRPNPHLISTPLRSTNPLHLATATACTHHNHEYRRLRPTSPSILPASMTGTHACLLCLPVCQPLRTTTQLVRVTCRRLWIRRTCLMLAWTTSITTPSPHRISTCTKITTASTRFRRRHSRTIRQWISPPSWLPSIRMLFNASSEPLVSHTDMGYLCFLYSDVSSLTSSWCTIDPTYVPCLSLCIVADVGDIVAYSH